MAIRNSLLPLIFLPAALACSSMQVQSARDPGTDLSKYHTYSWAPSVTGPPKGLLDQTLRGSVEHELEAKGLRHSTSSEPDLLVSYFGASHSVVNYSPDPYFGYPSYPAYGSTYVTREGSLTLQLVDPKTNRIVWQGTATDAIADTGAKPEQVAKAVNQLLEKYPNG